MWEAHKAYIRGVLIELGARKKKDRRKKIQKLTEELDSLEQKHKRQMGHFPQGTHKQIVIKRAELKTSMEQEVRATYSKVIGDRYCWANKPSKHLAKVVQKQKARNFIEKIQTKEGKIEYSSRKIAEVFKNYYQDLYSVSKQDTQANNRRERNNKYLKKAALPKITDMDREGMEEEVRKAIAGMASGKSPGPDGFTPIYYKTY